MSAAIDETYDAFLASKAVRAEAAGFDVDETEISAVLFEFQRAIVRWALRRGRSALFVDTGLGKTLMQLEWARHVAEHTGTPVLILAPLAVAQQTAREARDKLGITATVCRTQADVQPGINVTNYEMLRHFIPEAFGGIVLDESSILKSYMGKTKRSLVESFANTAYKLCCTATPAPNDHMEIGNHSEFLGVMRSGEMLMRWFINDTMAAGKYRLKGHAERDFWEWVASWAVSCRKPSDLGFSDDGFALPPLAIRHEIVTTDLSEGAAAAGMIFRAADLSATGIHHEMRLTAAARATKVAEIVNATPSETWAVWCNTNYEADELMARIPDAVEVRGNESVRAKEAKLLGFTEGRFRVIVTKPSVAGFGLNWQHCHHTAFVGLSYSFEQFYQATRRVWRYGQASPVECVVVGADSEAPVLATVERKLQANESMFDAMTAAASRMALQDDLRLSRNLTYETHQGNDWTLYRGDCVAVTRELPDASMHFSIFSPPFSQLYTYSDALEDMGNSAGDEEFFQHFGYLIPELYRVTVPGRLCAVHCKQLPLYKGRDGHAGLRDFRGEIIRRFSAAGWVYHSEVCIWTDPVLEMQRTKAHGLLYKQLRADSSFSRQGMAEYLVIFRKWPQSDEQERQIVPVTHTKETMPLDIWQQYASPVWMDVRRTRVLNVELARESRDEKHICPLQLDVIERAVDLWTNPGETVFSPFAGIGSEGHVALQTGRRFVGVELKRQYAGVAMRNLREAERKQNLATLWSIAEGIEVTA